MAAEQALALVVRGTDWSETSRITTLFTREFGKVRGLAKGGRRLKSSFDTSFDLLTVCRIVFLRKAHGGLDLLTEARMEERFPALRENLSALYAGYYVAELLSDGTQDYDPHPELFDAALDTLRKLGDPGEATADSVTRFELVWLKELGYSPRLDVCTGCGKAVPGGVPRVWFSAAAGGVVCTPCSPAQPDRRPLSGAAVRALAALTAGGPAELESVRAELRALLGQVVSFVLGRRPRMHRFLADG
ncbi:MAG TPA: DNA repair protein RecO [Urbifossiella sp.]|nr:DNA repair protein RecO [Urbifossiella sp.]